MAPNGMFLLPMTTTLYTPPPPPPPAAHPMEGLQRAVSDLSLLDLSIKAQVTEEAAKSLLLLPAPVEEDEAAPEQARCECCGMSEECTPGYIRRVRARFSGRWVCGLCAEAVREGVEKKGLGEEEALREHTTMCTSFNRFGRVKPLLGQAELMKQMLKRSSRLKKGGGIARSSSCIPAI